MSEHFYAGSYLGRLNAFQIQVDFERDKDGIKQFVLFEESATDIPDYKSGSHENKPFRPKCFFEKALRKSRAFLLIPERVKGQVLDDVFHSLLRNFVGARFFHRVRKYLQELCQRSLGDRFRVKHSLVKTHMLSYKTIIIVVIAVSRQKCDTVEGVSA